MYLVDIEKYRNNSSIETLLLGPYFYMFYDQCNEPHQGRGTLTILFLFFSLCVLTFLS